MFRHDCPVHTDELWGEFVIVPGVVYCVPLYAPLSQPITANIILSFEMGICNVFYER